jgi:hypothetical protein
MANDEPDTVFDPVTPNTSQMTRLTNVREAARVFGAVLNENLPPGPDKTYVFRTFRTAMMWASVAITKQPDGSSRS